MEDYPKEPIPDNSNLYYRIHKTYIVDGEIVPGAFQSKIDSMSTDWDKYSTPQHHYPFQRILQITE